MNGSNIDEFEYLLKKKTAADNATVVDRIETPMPSRLVADKSASIDDFILMLSTIVTKVMKKQKVEFKPDEGIRLTADQAESLDHPYIFFKILDYEPTREIKPRIRELETKIRPGMDLRSGTGEIWGQWATSIVQFDILAPGYEEAVAVMNKFEDTIFSYTAYFKRNGVKDIRFKRRLTDSNLDMYRQKCSVRSLQYSVDIEELFCRFNSEIEGVIVR